MLWRDGITASRFPIQEERADLQYDEGIDITYHFVMGRRYGLSPRQFLSNAATLQMLAQEECNRYLETRKPLDQRQRWFFASFKVKVNTMGKRGGKGEKLTRTYAAGKHREPDVMINGLDPKHGDVSLPKSTFLYQAIDKIERLVGEYRPGVALRKQQPFLVKEMVVSIRAGLSTRAREQEMMRLRYAHEKEQEEGGGKGKGRGRKDKK